MTVTPAMRRVLRAIANNDAWRASEDTVQAIVTAGLAEHVDWHGWRLTDAGRSAL